jgi:hypothetical protein
MTVSSDCVANSAKELNMLLPLNMQSADLQGCIRMGSIYSDLIDQLFYRNVARDGGSLKTHKIEERWVHSILTGAMSGFRYLIL